MPQVDTNKLARDLHSAIKQKDLQTVTKILDQNAPLAKKICNKPLPKVGTSLHTAATIGDPDILRLIIEKGCIDVNKAQSEGDLGILGRTALHDACAYGHEEVAEYLLQMKANPNATEACGLTPLHCACQGKKRAIADALITAGADINAQDQKLETPLLTSILRSAVDITTCLLDSYCDVTKADFEGQNAVHYAVEWGDFELVKRLISAGADFNLQDRNGRTPLHLAEDDEIREFLITCGADTATRDNKGRAHVAGNIDKEDYQDLNNCLQKHLRLAEDREIKCTAEVAEKVQQKFNRLAVNADSEIKAKKGDVMAELLSKSKQGE